MAASKDEGTPKSAYITASGFEKLRAEYEHLWRIERPSVTEQVSVAAAQGDRSENAEYIYGKKRLREIDSRLRFLAKRMDDLTVVEPEDGRETDQVFFGAWVTLEDEATHRVRYRIVGPDESDAGKGFVSMNSPLGRQVLAKRIGDEFTVNRPRGEVSYTVLEVFYSDPGSLDEEG